MFHRDIYNYLNKWMNRKKRKPLIIRGARQVGKTIAILEFSKKYFKNTVYLNLEKTRDKNIFKEVINLPDLIQLIQLFAGEKVIPGESLLFIDEIQNSAIAMTQLRYFYEEMPGLHVIAAGSLLEVKLKTEGFSIPVGRVEFMYMHPVTYNEFLNAINEKQTLDFLYDISLKSRIPGATHDLLLRKYYDYIIVGGMPEAVTAYGEGSPYIELDNIYESLLKSYRDDVFKYSSQAKSVYIQFIIEHCSSHVGTRIKYEKFAGSSYKSREMREAFDTLQKAMIINRIYASPSTKIPLMINYKKSPKLSFLDIGIVNYKLGLRENILDTGDLDAGFRGQIAEQIVAQTLCSLYVTREPEITFWYRAHTGASAEVDYLYRYKSNLIPIEVKAGKIGTLKSLHQFMLESGSQLALRVYSGNLDIQRVELKNNTSYRLLSLPFYLLFRLNEILAEFFL